MRHALLILSIAAAVGCGNGSGPKPIAANNIKTPPGGTTIEGLSRYALGEPVSYDNVTIVPVMLTTPSEKESQDYLSLSDAKKNALVEIRELPGREQVSTLLVRNLGKKPLLLLSGELLLGGKQDRVVAKDTVVPPGEEIEVPVFCVEHGRWSGKSSKFEPTSSMVPQSVRNSATYGSQEEVWTGVGEYNRSADSSEDTTSVRAGLYDAGVQRRVDADLGRFVAALDRQNNVVGFVVLVNGEIGSLELFGNTGLMRSSREALLRGFLADAAVRPSDVPSKADLDEVSSFIKDSLMGDRRQTVMGRGQANWSVSHDKGRGMESTLPAAEAPNAQSAPASASFLHGTYSPNR